MLESLLRCHPLLDLPLEALVDKVNKLLVVTLHKLDQTLGVWMSDLALRIGILKWSIIIIEEHLPPGCKYNH